MEAELCILDWISLASMHWDENQCECEGSKFLKFIDPDDPDTVLETFLQQIISRLTANGRPRNWRLELGNQLNDAFLDFPQNSDYPYEFLPSTCSRVYSLDPNPTVQSSHKENYENWVKMVGEYLRPKFDLNMVTHSSPNCNAGEYEFTADQAFWLKNEDWNQPLEFHGSRQREDVGVPPWYLVNYEKFYRSIRSESTPLPGRIAPG